MTPDYSHIAMNQWPGATGEVTQSAGTRLQFLGGLSGVAVAGAVPHFRVYGLQPPTDIVYTVWANERFRGYTVPVGGDVERPTALGLSDLRAMPQQTQMTRLSCVKGWSAIGTWRGVPLHSILAMVRPMSRSRFVVFHCFDRDPAGTPFYESLDLQHARDPETLLALDLDDRPIDADRGGPVRLHVPTEPGYKNAKWIRRIEVVSSIGNIAGGKGGYWEDRHA